MGDDESFAERAQQLTALVGSCALLGGRLEDSLHLLHQALAGPGPARVLHTYATTMDVLVGQCRKMLDASELDPAFREVGHEVLTEAKDTYDRRNAVIHGQWSSRVGAVAPGTFERRLARRKQINVTVQTLADVEAVATALANVGDRCRALVQAVEEGSLPADKDALARLQGNAKIPTVLVGGGVALQFVLPMPEEPPGGPNGTGD